MHEKRSMERFGLELKARVSMMNPGGDNEWIKVLTSNICAGGTFLLSRHPFRIGAKLNFEAVLPLSGKTSKLQNALIKTSGVVIRTEDLGIALRFDDEYEILPLPEPVLQ